MIGGYLGALLLGGTYLSIGLCVSARTDNQVVSLMLTLVIAGALYFLGSDAAHPVLRPPQTADRAALPGQRLALHQYRTRRPRPARPRLLHWAWRFFFLSLNWYFLESERIDHGSARGYDRAPAKAPPADRNPGRASTSSPSDLWLAPDTTPCAIDMTERGEYSISQDQPQDDAARRSTEPHQ